MQQRNAVSPLLAGLGCRCPKCGTGHLFAQPFSLGVNERCATCGLDFQFIDPGDGPAVFAIMLLGFVILGAAMVVEFQFRPPLWAHIAIWAPITACLAFGLLRPLKAILVAMQYRYRAGQHHDLEG